MGLQTDVLEKLLQWFYEETRLHNGVRAADLSKLCFLPKLNNKNKQKLSKLAQNVLLRGHHNRIYHYNLSSRLPQKIHYHSVELPLYWLLYYDAISRVSRDPTELYGLKIFSVPYLILPDKTKRESHYYYATSDFKGDKLIPSKRLKITIFHSSYTTSSSTNK